jgi:hypothetical protein
MKAEKKSFSIYTFYAVDDSSISGRYIAWITNKNCNNEVKKITVSDNI